MVARLEQGAWVLVRAEGLSVSRGGVPVLAGVGFTLAAGQALVLRGPNGVGKTTLLRTVAGLQPPLSGHLHVPPEGVAFAGHADGLKATLSVAENLRFWAAIHGTGDIGPALQALDLGALTARQAQHLSAGQKRRLGLARLMVTGRAVWVLDEPTVSLDAAATAAFGAMVRRHLAAGGAAVMASHIDLGLPEAVMLDLTPFRAVAGRAYDAPRDAFAEAVE